MYVLKDYQRLKQEEQGHLEWNIRRLIAKANFSIHTEAVRQNIVPVVDWNTGKEAIYQATESDVLNLALFGMTARQFKESYPNAAGNLRDNASALQLLVLASLEVSNAELLEQGLARSERIFAAQPESPRTDGAFARHGIRQGTHQATCPAGNRQRRLRVCFKSMF